MANEIERRFLVKKNFNIEGLNSELIIQGYLSTDKNKTVRVRIKGNKGFITVKGLKINSIAPEFEYEIPKLDALEMLDKMCTNIIEKIRYYYIYDEIMWEIDVFLQENEGLVIAEIEMNDYDEDIKIPDFCEEEITNDYKYSNSNLSLNPYKRW